MFYNPLLNQCTKVKKNPDEIKLKSAYQTENYFRQVFFSIGSPKSVIVFKTNYPAYFGIEYLLFQWIIIVITGLQLSSLIVVK